ncbi:hypothetical protein AAG906_008041 [Vitis piasezkii]
MELKSWIFYRYGSPKAINHPKTSPSIEKSTFKCTHCNKTDPTSLDIPQFQSNDSWYDQENNEEPRDSKKTSTANVAKIKTKANVAEKVSTLVAATNHGTITSAAYLINRVPSSSINFQTPLQALTNVAVAPTVPNLPPRVFGCVAFVHLHKHQRTKLTSHALQCVDIDVTILQLDECLLQWMWCFMKIRWEYHKEIQTLDYDYHISKDDESGQSELVNQEASELDMSGQQFGSEDVFTEIPNQSSARVFLIWN